MRLFEVKRNLLSLFLNIVRIYVHVQWQLGLPILIEAEAVYAVGARQYQGWYTQQSLVARCNTRARSTARTSYNSIYGCLDAGHRAFVQAELCPNDAHLCFQR